ncbi:MAG: hypothetical protein ACRDSO_12810, partial [Pseudonocardiaceae bacterium]
MRRQPYGRYYRWGPARRPSGPLLVLLFAVLLATVGLVAVTLVTLVPLMLVGVGAVTVVRHLHRRRV